MTDLVTRLRRGWLKPLHTPTEFAEAADMIESLQAENARLNRCITEEQNRAEHIGTHGASCHTWGHRHYECAVRELAAVTKQRDIAVAALKEIAGFKGTWLAERAEFAIRQIGEDQCKSE